MADTIYYNGKIYKIAKETDLQVVGGNSLGDISSKIAALGVPLGQSLVSSKTWSTSGFSTSPDFGSDLLTGHFEMNSNKNPLVHEPLNGIPPHSDKPKRIHVSNIPFWVTERELLEVFEPYGKIDEVQIISNERGSKGFGFVTFKKGSNAELAKAMMNRYIWHGRVIEVNDAHPKSICKYIPKVKQVPSFIQISPSQNFDLSASPKSPPFGPIGSPASSSEPSSPASPDRLASPWNEYNPFTTFDNVWPNFQTLSREVNN